MSTLDHHPLRAGAGPWQRPRLRDPDGEQPDQRVSWLELFFDLVFVVVISRLSHDLAHHLTPGAVLVFAIQFLAVFWLWTPFAYYTERFHSEGLETRLFTFLAIVPVAGLAVFGENGLGENYVGFAAAYLLTRVVNQIHWLRAALHNPVFRPVALRFCLGYLVVACLILGSFAASPTWRVVLFAVAVLLDVATPYTTVGYESRMSSQPTSSRFSERFGLFTIIVLGESVVGVIVGLGDRQEAHQLTAIDMVAGAFGLAVGFSVWWIYFDFVARRAPRPSLVSTLLWVQLHAVTLMAITAAGAGISVTLGSVEPGAGGVAAAGRYLLVGGVVVTLLGVAALQVTLARDADEPTHPVVSPLLKVVVAVVLGVAGAVYPGWSIFGLLTLLVVGLAVPMCYGSYVWYRSALLRRHSWLDRLRHQS